MTDAYGTPPYGATNSVEYAQGNVAGAYGTLTYGGAPYVTVPTVTPPEEVVITDPILVTGSAVVTVDEPVITPPSGDEITITDPISIMGSAQVMVGQPSGDVEITEQLLLVGRAHVSVAPLLPPPIEFDRIIDISQVSPVMPVPLETTLTSRGIEFVNIQRVSAKMPVPVDEIHRRAAVQLLDIQRVSPHMPPRSE